MASFAAQVSGWVNGVKGASEAILKQSAQELINEAQTPRAQGGRMRVDTGFLRASLMASTTAMPQIDPTAKPLGEGETYTPGDTVIEAVIAGAELGETIYIGYTAAYALRREFGFTGFDSLNRYYNEPGDAFVRTAAQNWPEIVRRVEKQLSARLAFSGPPRPTGAGGSGRISYNRRRR